MSKAMMLFSAATLLPLPLVALAALLGGPWAFIAPAWLALVAAGLDGLSPAAAPDAPEEAEFPAADRLSATLAVGHFVLLALSVAALSGDWLSVAEKAGVFIAAGLFFGQISNSNAHELIHRGARGLRRLGVWVYITLLFGHHASAHPLVHHRWVATRRDPNSARLGESYYRFAARAWRGSFREGLRAESARRKGAGQPAWRHPYAHYGGGALLTLALAALIGGWGGALALLGLAFFAQSQLLLSDYVQHYGLSRAIDERGKPEPVAARHSWNAPHRFTSAQMLNAPRHSDHHAHPMRKYPSLRLPADSPTLPHSLPVMAGLALVPPLWHRRMRPLAKRWRVPEQETAA